LILITDRHGAQRRLAMTSRQTDGNTLYGRAPVPSNFPVEKLHQGPSSARSELARELRDLFEAGSDFKRPLFGLRIGYRSAQGAHLHCILTPQLYIVQGGFHLRRRPQSLLSSVPNAPLFLILL
jgi:hypothetical protein